MALKLAGLDEKIALANLALRKAFARAAHDGDFAETMALKVELAELERLRADLLAEKQAPPSKGGKKRGPKPDVMACIVSRMREDRRKGEDLAGMKNEEMGRRYGASPATCVKARNSILHPHIPE